MTHRDETLEDETYCYKCSTNTDPQTILLCDGCDAEAHITCLGLSSVPSGDWFCERCEVLKAAAKETSKDGQAEEQTLEGAEGDSEAQASQQGTKRDLASPTSEDPAGDKVRRQASDRVHRAGTQPRRRDKRQLPLIADGRRSQPHVGRP